jgi:hypothetical protein
MTTLIEPQVMNRREQVADLLRGLPAYPISELHVQFGADSYPTTSFVDELVRQTLGEHRVELLVLLDADDFLSELALEAAVRQNVADRLRLA